MQSRVPAVIQALTRTPERIYRCNQSVTAGRANVRFEAPRWHG
jgi:hypothetical protein